MNDKTGVQSAGEPRDELAGRSAFQFFLQFFPMPFDQIHQQG